MLLPLRSIESREIFLSISVQVKSTACCALNASFVGCRTPWHPDPHGLHNHFIVRFQQSPEHSTCCSWAPGPGHWAW